MRDAGDRGQSKRILDELTDYLRTKSPDRSSFIESFKRLSFKNDFTKDKKLIQYTFSKIERHLQGTNELDIYQFSLEHIESQTGSTFRNFDRIGNLLPLSEALNNEADSKPFTDKLPIYGRSSLSIVSHFLSRNGSKTNWTEDDIDQRSQYIAELSFDQIWNF